MTAANTDATIIASSQTDEREIDEIEDPESLDERDDDGVESDTADANSGGTDGGKDSAAGDGALSDDLLTRAKEAGLTEDEAKATDAASLLKVLDLFDRRVASLGRTPGRTPPEGGEAAGEASGKHAQPDDVIGQLTINEDAAEPEVVAAFKTMANELARLQGRLGEIESAGETERAARLFTSVPKEQVELFGSADTVTAAQRANRERVLDEMRALRAGLKATGKTVPGEAELFERAKRSALGDQLQTIARKKLTEQARSRSGQFTARPTQREGKPLSPERRATSAVAAKMNSFGVGDGSGSDDEVI